MEIVNGAARTGLSFEEWLLAAKEAGLDTIPGTAAEILDDDVRWVLTKGKLPTATWLEVVAPRTRRPALDVDDDVRPRRHPGPLGRAPATLAALQDETGGFTEFVPLPFVHHNSPIYLAGVARPGPTVRENRAVHAVARLLLHGLIDNIQTSWVKLGEAGTKAVLQGGANDLGGTLMEETISRMAGIENGSLKTIAEIEAIAAAIGRPPVSGRPIRDAVRGAHGHRPFRGGPPPADPVDHAVAESPRAVRSEDRRVQAGGAAGRPLRASARPSSGGEAVGARGGHGLCLQLCHAAGDELVLGVDHGSLLRSGRGRAGGVSVRRGSIGRGRRGVNRPVRVMGGRGCRS